MRRSNCLLSYLSHGTIGRMLAVIIGLLFICVFFLQMSLLPIPLLAGSLVALFAVFHKNWIIVVAFFLGILIDSIAFQRLGISSLFYVGLVGLMLLYSRKFEVETIPFVGVFSLIAGVSSIFLFGGNIFINLLLLVVIAFLSFFLFLFLKNIFVRKQLHML